MVFSDKEEAELKWEALDVLDDLYSNPYLWTVISSFIGCWVHHWDKLRSSLIYNGI